MNVRRTGAAVGLAVLAVSCSWQSVIPRPALTEVPFCAPFEEELGSRAMMGDQGTTCSVKLAKYDNLADHRPLVWVVHLDGLAIEAMGGPFVINGTQPPPRFLRRALALVTSEASATPITSLATGR